MKYDNSKRQKQLGLPFGTACNRLRKMLLFSFCQKLGLDTCFKCGTTITNISEFSIEHKKNWLDVDPQLFWNLDNIAFSHSKCNKPERRTVYRINAKEGHSICSVCKLEKPSFDFYKRKSRWNGLQHECKKCADEKRK
jgi:hypothetical protein